MNKWRYFKLSEFDCRCCGENLMQHDFIDKLDALRRFCGFPLIITSGYRCPNHNIAVSTTGSNGPHTTGRAADIAISGSQAHTMLMHVFRLNAFSGIGLNQTGDRRFIHLDDLQHDKRPWVWTY